jgi:hypothetical protein
MFQPPMFKSFPFECYRFYFHTGRMVKESMSSGGGRCVDGDPAELAQEEHKLKLLLLMCFYRALDPFIRYPPQHTHKQEQCS